MPLAAVIHTIKSTINGDQSKEINHFKMWATWKEMKCELRSVVEEEASHGSHGVLGEFFGRSGDHALEI